jgi:plasmid stabilization system protein ParE
MKVVWTEQAEEALNKTVTFIHDEFGYNAARRYVKSVYNVGNLLASNPHLGHLEPLLADLTIGYRSIVVNRLSKLIYRIVDDRIEIADLWDTRREPQSQVSQVK